MGKSGKNPAQEKLEIVPFNDKSLVKKSFSEESAEFKHLIEWLRVHAWPCQHEKTCKIYLAFRDDKLVGYIAVNTANLKLPAKKYNNTHDPTVLSISKLFVAESSRRHGTGTQLVLFALDLAGKFDELIGCRGLVVDSHEKALDFYTKFGFKVIDSQKDPFKMFFPMP